MVTVSLPTASSSLAISPALLLALTLALLGWPGPSAADDFQGATHLMPFDEDTLKYSKTAAQGSIARLQQRLDRGELKLEFEEGQGYLKSILRALDVPRASQVLVFSKTSLQRERISPQNPRALYFNDDVYVGFIPGAPLLEFSEVDPKLGGVFYTLEQARAKQPRFVRTDQCLECHASAKSMGVPGHLLRSFAVDEQGVVDLVTGVSLVNHRTPLAERWGGWYVTGEPGGPAHRGNLFGKAAFERQARDPAHRGTLRELSDLFNPAPYPEDSSDIVALLVLEHQTHMHNFITRLHYESTLALQQYGHVNYLRNIIDGFLKYLLFSEEAALAQPIRGGDAYARAFTAQGPRDARGRSLRDLDLQDRLFRHPCSFLIYSEAFDRLPDQVREAIYQRLHDILTGQDTRPQWEHLSRADRRAIREILAATKPGLPAYWKQAK
ncbi:MAG: hypothetical protein RJA22_2273 [Verrucomicrobiota bacterium]